jgi:hypothetical protein
LLLPGDQSGRKTSGFRPEIGHLATGSGASAARSHGCPAGALTG